jgi:hypothetical protein
VPARYVISPAPVAYPVITGDVSPIPVLDIAVGAIAGSSFLDVIRQRLLTGWSPIVFGESLKREMKRREG